MSDIQKQIHNLKEIVESDGGNFERILEQLQNVQVHLKQSNLEAAKDAMMRVDSPDPIQSRINYQHTLKIPESQGNIISGNSRINTNFRNNDQ